MKLTRQKKLQKVARKKRFKIEDWHKNKRSNKPYDILAVKNGKEGNRSKTGSAHR